MVSLLTSVVLLSFAADPVPAIGVGVLFQPNFSQENVLREPAQSYCPGPGDLFLCTDHLRIIRAGHALAGTFAPHHSGIIILRPDGAPAMLEAGPHNSLKVRLLEMEANLRSYEAVGNTIWIRRRAVPLTKEQSKKLTDYAMAQDGKDFAWGRMLAQMTPFRSRGPLRTDYLGKPHGERDSYFCSELVMETLLAAGLADPAKTRPSATYPRDIYFGKSTNAFLDENLELNKAWQPPARWFSQIPVKK